MGDETVQLLQGWHAGDGDCLNGLLERHLPFIRGVVRKRLGPELRKNAETGDYIQEAVVQVLKYSPRFKVTDDEHFRALLVRIVENSLRDRHHWFTAQRRDYHRVRPLPSDTVLDLDRVDGRQSDTPSQVAWNREREALVRLGVELLGPEDRRIVVLRDWKGLSFGEIAELLEINPRATQKRHDRARGRLVKKVKALRVRDLQGALERDDEEARAS